MHWVGGAGRVVTSGPQGPRRPLRPPNECASAISLNFSDFRQTLLTANRLACTLTLLCSAAAMIQALDNAAAHSLHQTESVFRHRFGSAPDMLFRAPGRVNLIGEHTDYNDGFVMPAALEFSTYVAVGRRNDRNLEVHSTNFGETVAFHLDELSPAKIAHWSDYVAGVAAILDRRVGGLKGANVVVHGEVPIGAGLSSSAAIEVATAMALLANSRIEMDFLDIAKCCQQAEHEYTGARCGIMDQFVSCFGRAGHALMLDCRTFDYQLLPLKPEISIVICNSKVRHELASGEYNLRRRDCEESVQKLRQFKPTMKALRDINEEELRAYGDVLSEPARRRCRHVVGENARVLSAAQMLRSGDLNGFGDLMYQSHASLRDLYEVSCRELDVLVELAAKIDGVYGARMTGGGFGGCTVNLVHENAVSQFQSLIAEDYKKRIGITPDIFVCRAANGAAIDQAIQ